MSNRHMPLVTALLLVVGSTSVIGAQASTPAAKPMKEEKAGLLKQATVAPDAARQTALARVPKGRIDSEEIEIEDGRLVYSFDIAVAGRPGVEEVLVDAKTGTVISQEHESPAKEAQEAKEGRKRAKVPHGGHTAARRKSDGR